MQATHLGLSPELLMEKSFVPSVSAVAGSRRGSTAVHAAGNGKLPERKGFFGDVDPKGALPFAGTDSSSVLHMKSATHCALHVV